jgi:hypothetical protein
VYWRLLALQTAMALWSAEPLVARRRIGVGSQRPGRSAAT